MSGRFPSNPVTVQPDWTTYHHNPTEQLLRLLASRTKSLRITLLPWPFELLLRQHE
jgi:hypothetical protein